MVFSKKGQSGRVLEIGTDADVSLLESKKNAAEGIKPTPYELKIFFSASKLRMYRLTA